MLDKNKIGHEFTTFSTEVEKGRLKFFAKAIGETNPIYTNDAAAQAAGYPSLPAPPTFLMALDADAPENMPILDILNIDIARILHGSQEFEYFAPICAGDTISIGSRITDIFDKKGGALEFVVFENTYTNQSGKQVAKAKSTLVVRNG
jgi:acyl dehydratase